MKPKTFTCSHCGGEFPALQRPTFLGEDFCSNCLSETTRICTDCGSRFLADQDMGHNGSPPCPRCYNRHYTTCDHCRRTISLSDVYYEDDDEDQDYPLRLSCFQHRSNEKVIHDYAPPSGVALGRHQNSE